MTVETMMSAFLWELCDAVWTHHHYWYLYFSFHYSLKDGASVAVPFSVSIQDMIITR
jgi:hypothetical protein